MRGKCCGVDGSEHRLPDKTESESEGGGAAGQRAELLIVRNNDANITKSTSGRYSHIHTTLHSYPCQDIALTFTYCGQSNTNPNFNHNQLMPNHHHILTPIHTLTRTSQVKFCLIRTGLRSPLGLMVPTRSVFKLEEVPLRNQYCMLSHKRTQTHTRDVKGLSGSRNVQKTSDTFLQDN